MSTHKQTIDLSQNHTHSKPWHTLFSLFHSIITVFKRKSKVKRKIEANTMNQQFNMYSNWQKIYTDLETSLTMVRALLLLIFFCFFFAFSSSSSCDFTWIWFWYVKISSALRQYLLPSLFRVSQCLYIEENFSPNSCERFHQILSSVWDS